MINKLIEKKNKYLASIDAYKAEITKLEGKVEVLDEIIAEECVEEVKDILDTQVVEVAESCGCDECSECDCVEAISNACDEVAENITTEVEQPVQNFYFTGI